jgi:hypothetical protein
VLELWWCRHGSVKGAASLFPLGVLIACMLLHQTLQNAQRYPQRHVTPANAPRNNLIYYDAVDKDAEAPHDAPTQNSSTDPLVTLDNDPFLNNPLGPIVARPADGISTH